MCMLQGSLNKSIKHKNNSVNDCKYCGKDHPRDKEKCPAYGKTCNKCGKSNHLATVCKASDQKSGDKKWHRKKKVHQSEMQYESDSEESLYACYRISAVNGSHKSKFMTKMKFHINETDKVMTVHLDSGATCSAMSYADLQEILGSSKTVKLDPPAGKVKLYDGTIVKPRGQYRFNVSIGNGKQSEIVFYVMDQAPWHIIDGDTCIKNGWLDNECYPSHKCCAERNSASDERKNISRPQKCLHWSRMPARRISHRG